MWSHCFMSAYGSMSESLIAPSFLAGKSTVAVGARRVALAHGA